MNALIPSKRKIDKSITNRLASEGAVRKSNSWYIHTSETALIINLQKSHYCSKYYMNIGIFLDDTVVDLGAFLPEFKADIRLRLSGLVPEQSRYIFEEALDFDIVADDDNRILVVLKIVNDVLVPMLRIFATRRGVLGAYRNGTLSAALITKIGMQRLLATAGKQDAQSY